MTCNNIVLLQPEAGVTVNHNIPDDVSARLNFSPEDIEGLRMGGDGELVISFLDGGQLNITNFDALVDNGNLLYLEDGTLIDPSILSSSLQTPQNFNAIETAAGAATNADAIKIGQPAPNTKQQVTLQAGQKYVCDFDPANAAVVEIKDGQMVLTFADGSQVIIDNYTEVMAGNLPAELTLEDGTVIDGEELLTTVTEVETPEEVLEVAEEEAEDGEEVANIEPAAGEDVAETLAQIEPAAGEGGATGNTGYGFNSSPVDVPLNSPDAIGPLGPTALRYGAPQVQGDTFLLRDDVPIVSATALTLDETALLAGNIVSTGSVTADFGNDGPGTLAANGAFSATGSVDNGTLASNGVPIVVNFDATTQTYTGVAGTTTIFTLEFTPSNGTYTFTQFEQIDHADATNDNDVINLNFGVSATDADGDTTPVNIRVNILDDAPVALSQIAQTVDETNLTAAGVTTTGQFHATVGQDAPGTYAGTNQFTATGSVAGGSLTSCGFPVTVTFDAGTNTYTGVANGVTVFTMVLDANTGAYEFTLFQGLDHADTTNPNDQINLNFGASVTDYDGDTATATLTVRVLDDAPESTTSSASTDESNATITATGTLALDYGNDTASATDPAVVNGNFAASGSLTGGNLTSGGVAVTVGFDAATNTYTGTAGGNTVFTLVFDPATGNYTYTQIRPLDHADSNNDNDVITLDFGIDVTDKDGDTAESTITITVADDAPTLNSDQETLDETDLGSGPVVINGSVTHDFGLDGQGSFDTTGSFASSGSQLGGNLTSGGVPVVVTFDAGTNTYTGNAGAAAVFTMVINSDGTYTFTLLDTLDHADPNNPNDIINLDFGIEIIDGDGDSDDGIIRIRVKDDVPTIGDSSGDVDESNLDGGSITYTDTLDTNFGIELSTVTTNGVTNSSVALTSCGHPVTITNSNNVYTGTANGVTVFTLTVDPVTGQYTYEQFESLDHPDTNDNDEIISIDFGVAVTNSDGDSDTGTITINIADDGPEAVNDINGAEEDQLITGDVRANDDLSQDGQGANDNTVTNVRFNGTDYPVAVGTPTVIVGDYGTLTINSDGTYAYQARGNDPDGVDSFAYTLTDCDGDSSTATLDITVTPDGQPVAVDESIAVDETNLTPGPMIFNGDLNVNFGLDGGGTITLLNNVTPGGSLLNGNLTSNGVPVVTTISGNTYTGRAGGNDVFTLTINNDGTYRFHLLDHIDHGDSTDPNDIITINFGIRVADADGDTADGSVTIYIHDDAPVAYDDARVTLNESETVTGNVTTNDELSEDNPNNVVQVIFNGTATNVPATGTVNITGQFGVLTISATGEYSYTANSKHNPDGVDTFTYVLEDYDGDQDTAEFSFKVNPIDDQPVIVPPTLEVVDETDLPGGPLTETGTITVDYATDGPGTVDPNGTFTFDGSVSNNLTSCGNPITVTLSGNTYTGVANGVTIFTMTILENGNYTFTQFHAIDHADTADHNDFLNLNFGAVATDLDGDQTNTTVTVRVFDDGPDIGNAVQAVDESDLTAGNIDVTGTLAHDFGGDEGGAITPNGLFQALFQMNGAPVALTSGGQAITVATTANGYVGTAGGQTIFSLTINPDTGEYRYQQFGTIDHPDTTNPDDVIWLKFYVDITDCDGDHDTGTIVIDVHDDGPEIASKSNAVNETGLNNGDITITGSLTHDFGADGQGSIKPNGTVMTLFKEGGNNQTFTSGGVAIVITETANGYVGKAGNQTIFTLSIDPATGNYTYKQFDAIDHPGTDKTGTDDVIWLKFGVTITDGDGDTDTAFIQFDVRDDGPNANNDTLTLNNTQTSRTGSVVSNDSFGADGAGGVTNPGTYVGTYGTLILNANGTYTYTRTGQSGGVDTFNYTIRDADGDTDTATLTVTVAADYNPTGISGSGATDDDNTIGTASDVETGTINVNYHGDGPGTTTANGNFSSGGNQLGALSSNGQNVSVTLSGNTYTGTAGGKTIFTMTINPDGTYRFVQHENLDHSVTTNHNEALTLNFGVRATDADGDTGNGTVTITVRDDGPEISDKTNGVNETSLNSGDITVNGTVPHNFGADGQGAIRPNGTVMTLFKVGGNNQTFTSGGVAIVITETANGYVGKAGTATIFTLTINPNTGAYTYKQFDTIDHPGTDKTGTDDVIWLKFGVTITDGDGDTDTGFIQFDIRDDGPNAVNDSLTLNNTQTSRTGNVLNNDTFGADGAGGITNPGTYVGTYGTLILNANGTYTYTRKNGTGGVDTFNYTIRDADGDTDTATLTVTVAADGTPTGITGSGETDDDNTIGAASDVETGTITVNYNGDAPGATTGNGQFSTSGSVDTGTLRHEGTAVNVTFNAGNNTYTGTAAGKTIFTMTINANGTYRFVQYENLDHSNDSSHNEALYLNFGVRATDADGDTGNGTVTITVRDDGPEISDKTNGVNETSLNSGDITVNGTVPHNFGADGQGAIRPNGTVMTLFKVGGNNQTFTSGGVAIVITETANGYVGKAGTATIFTLTINPNTGAYTYKQFDTIDHPGTDKTGTDDVIWLKFGVTITDGEGDTDTGFIQFDIRDDGPNANNDTLTLSNSQTSRTGNVVSNDSYGADGAGAVTNPGTYVGTYGTLVLNANGTYTYTRKNGTGGVDTFNYTIRDADGDTDTATLTVTVAADGTPTGITGSGTTDDDNTIGAASDVETGTITVNYNGDGAGSTTGNGQFSTSGNVDTGTLRHEGSAVSVSYNAANNTYTGTAAGKTIFTMTINANGTYRFVQYENLDHSNDSSHNEALYLNFGVRATDADGDTGNGTVRITVLDDGPTARNDALSLSNSQTSRTGNVLSNDSAGADDRSIAVTTPGTYNGTYGTLVLNANGTYTYTRKGQAGGTDTFNYTMRDGEGDTATATLTVTVATDHNPTGISGTGTTDDDNTIGAASDVETGTISVNYHGDGAGSTTGNGQFSANGNVDTGTLRHEGSAVSVSYNAANNTYTGTAAGKTIFTMTINANGTYRFVQHENLDHSQDNNHNEALYLNFGVRATDADGDTGNGTVRITVLDDGPNAVNDTLSLSRTQTSRTGNVLSNDSAGADDRSIAVTTPGTYNGTYGTLVLNANGTYTYTRHGRAGGTDTFNYTMRDGEGDTDTATLTVTVTPESYSPIDIRGTGETDDTIVDNNGSDVETGNISVNYQGDGTGTTTANGNFSSGGNQLGALSSNGQNVSVTLSGNTYTGTAGGRTIFTMTINANGTYRFVQHENLDHSVAGNNNEALTLNFGVRATDPQGDTGNGTVTITVRDDGPDAANDTLSLSRTQNSRTGNVLSNDDAGADDGSNVRVTTPGTYNGTYGTLVLNANGTYTYTRKGQAGGTDTFNYTMRDHDGDTDTATLTVTVATDHNPTGITGSGTTDDDNTIGSASDVETGTISVNYNGDGAGSTTGNGQFSASGNIDTGVLRHEGSAVSVSYNASNRTYTGTAAGKTIFTMTINTNGTYRFVQYENLDHSQDNNHNEALYLNFGVRATDADGDTGNGTVRITVLDDGPTARDDSNNVSRSETRETGNVLSNDSAGADDRSIAVTTPGTFNGTYGTLVLNANGSYTYTRKGQAGGTDVFNYTMRDGEGDTASAKLTISVAADHNPTGISGSGTTDDDNTIGNASDVETGTISVNYNGDGAGSTTGNGQFSTSGSVDTGTLRHEGNVVSVNFNSGNNTYTGTAAGKTIFTMTINANGTYRFVQYENLDHSNDSSHNEALYLRFGVRATDADGDTGNGTVVITVLDDGPTARNDSNSVGNNFFNRTVTGNVLSNDSAGADDRSIAVTTAGTYVGTFGTLTLNANGSYSYTRTNFSRGGTDRFNYTMRDGEGDTASATLSISNSNPPPPPPPPPPPTWGGDGDGGDGDGCPLVIDLDGDGIELISKEDGVLFDMNEDGIDDQTAWVGADDGILVRDINGDGIINDHSEMFGNDQIGGFEMLAQYDDNNDGVIDAQDAIWSTLAIWQDRNGDAFSQADEFITFDELGITAINLAVREVNLIIAGNDVTVVGDFITNDGGSYDGYDAWFAYDSGDGSDGVSGLNASSDADNFIFQAIRESALQINNFDVTEDTVDLSALIEGADDITEAINEFVFVTEEDGNTIISVDVDGSAGPAEAVEIAKLEGVSADDIIDSDSIVI